MTETLPLPKLPRGHLLPESRRVKRLHDVAPVLESVVAGEGDAIVLMATFSAAIWQALPQCTWVGFYRRVTPRELAVGPYQGGVGCLRIPFERGVCGACARTGVAQRVDDVTARPDHIACDPATRSELVLPIIDAGGGVQAVFDLDSAVRAAFSVGEARILATLLRATFGGVRWGCRFAPPGSG